MRFNQCKSNIKLYGEVRTKFKQKKSIEPLYSESYDGNHQDINIKMIDFCDFYDQETPEYFWVKKL